MTLFKEKQHPEIHQLVAEYSMLFLNRRASNLLVQHIKGEITLGAYALNADSEGQWLCFDADDRDEWIKLWQFAKAIEKDGITPIV